MAITDLTNTTWVFNDTLDFSSLGLNQDESKSWSVNFTLLVEYLNAPNTIKIEYGIVDVDEKGNEYLGYSLIYVYTPTTGVSEPHLVYLSNSSIGFLGWNASEQAIESKTIKITGGTDATNTDLINWLQANATQQATPTTDTKPVYKRINSEWVKQLAFERVNGQWVKISSK